MKQSARSQSVIKASVAPARKNFILILVIFFAAFTVGLVAVGFNEVFLWGTNLARERFFNRPEISFLTVPAFFLISAWLCRKFAPNAAGGGPEHVISALQKRSASGDSAESVSEFLSFKILVIKMLSSIICITGGGALGREGPVVQISASIFVLVAEKTKKILPHFSLRTWIIAGSSAGMAAAFNTPIAGIIFAIEELSQFHFKEKYASFKTKVFFAVIVAGLTAQFITGSYVLFEFPAMHFDFGITIIAVFIIISVSCGIAGFLLKTLCSKTTNWRNSVKGRLWYFIPIACGILVAFVSYYLGINTFGAGLFTITHSLESSGTIITYQESLGRFVNIIATMASGCAGGLLLPSLAIGAGIGSLGSTLLPMFDARIFMTVGMAALLSPVLNAPLTAAVLVIEITNQRELVFPIFLSAIISSWIFDKLKGFYENGKGLD